MRSVTRKGKSEEFGRRFVEVVPGLGSFGARLRFGQARPGFRHGRCGPGEVGNKSWVHIWGGRLCGGPISRTPEGRANTLWEPVARSPAELQRDGGGGPEGRSNMPVCLVAPPLDHPPPSRCAQPRDTQTVTISSMAPRRADCTNSYVSQDIE